MNAENISLILDELATRFGSTGAALWDSLVLYERVSALTPSILLIALTIAAGPIMRFVTAQDESMLGDGFAPFLCLVLLTVAVIMSAAFSLAGVPAIIAPEAAVLKGLLP